MLDVASSPSATPGTDSPTSAPSVPTSTAAPATSAPSTPIRPDQRPTFEQAFARDAVAPAPVVPVEGAPVATAPGETPAVEAPKGPIPFDVHKTALDNARKKEAERLTAEFQSQYGWAQQLDRPSVEAAMSLGQRYQSDKPGFIREVLAEALQDATLAPLIRSEAARALSSGRGQPAAQEPDLSPDIPVMDANGQIVAQTFSAQKVQQIVERAIAQAVKPLQQDFQTRQQREQAAKQEQEISTAATDIYTEALDVLPGFKDHQDAIQKVFLTIPGDPAKALRQAWKQVVGGTLSNADQVRAEQLKALQTKAASSVPNPAAASSAPAQRPRSFHDPALKWG